MSTKNYKYFESLIEATAEAELGNLFGKPCGKLNKKAFVAFFQDEMVFKVGKEEVNLLLDQYKGSQNFDPSGKNRPMKDWIQVPSDYQADWKELLWQAKEFIKQ